VNRILAKKKERLELYRNNRMFKPTHCLDVSWSHYKLVLDISMVRYTNSVIDISLVVAGCWPLFTFFWTGKSPYGLNCMGTTQCSEPPTAWMCLGHTTSWSLIYLWLDTLTLLLTFPWWWLVASPCSLCFGLGRVRTVGIASEQRNVKNHPLLGYVLATLQVGP
jgi:hypothetical protein